MHYLKSFSITIVFYHIIDVYKLKMFYLKKKNKIELESRNWIIN